MWLNLHYSIRYEWLGQWDLRDFIMKLLDLTSFGRSFIQKIKRYIEDLNLVCSSYWYKCNLHQLSQSKNRTQKEWHIRKVVCSKF